MFKRLQSLRCDRFENMNLAELRNLLITLVALSTLICNEVSCGRVKGESSILYQTGRFIDISRAINFMQKSFHDHTPFEERCKRYAILTARALFEKSAFESTVYNITSMSDNEVLRQYDELGTDKISSLYMTAIDRFRVTQLAPAFIDLIECLERIDTPLVKGYLGNQELVVIRDLYRQVLGLSGTKVDLRSLDLTKFRQAFWSALRNLFRQYLDVDSIFGPSCREQEAELMKDQLSRKQQRYIQHREHSRLKQQRLRLMYPDAIRKYQQERRRLLKEREISMFTDTSDLPEANETKRRAQERRDRRNERRRRNRKLIREQKKHQTMIAHQHGSLSDAVSTNQKEVGTLHEPVQDLVRDELDLVSQLSPEDSMIDNQAWSYLSMGNDLRHKHNIVDTKRACEQGQLDEFMSFLQSLQSESPEDHRTHQDLIDSSICEDDETDAMLDLIMKQQGAQDPNRSPSPDE